MMSECRWSSGADRLSRLTTAVKAAARLGAAEHALPADQPFHLAGFVISAEAKQRRPTAMQRLR